MVAGWIVAAFVACIAIWLGWKARQKQELDDKEQKALETELARLSTKVEAAHETIDQYDQTIRQKKNEISLLDKESNAAIERYNNSLRYKTQELDDYIEAQKRRRREILDEDLAQEEKQRRDRLEATMKEMTGYAQARVNQATFDADKKCEELQARIAQTQQLSADVIARFEGLLETARKYEIEQQEKLYYTIQVPEEYRDDIEFLITTVSQKVQHPDVINKLVWTEYIKPYLDDTFKRAGIEDKPGIYKITNINDQKAYIGKSTNVKKRISDHIKSSCGIQSIADQAVHHAIWKSGIWNWMIEPVIYCDKDKLSELEKYYIDVFQTQIYGFNRKDGG